MSFGKSGSTQTVIPELTQEQKDYLKAQTGFFTGTIAPTYETAVKGATDIYNLNAGGVLTAAQNLGGTAAQAQETLGETGESALRTGVTGLQSLFDPNYERNQIMAALAPAQQQYAQNVAGQAATFGGAGQLGSARQALAGRQLAGSAQAAQMAAAAEAQKNVQAQRMAAATRLAELGQGGIGQALGAAGQKVSASMIPQEFYNKYASIIFGTPQGSYTPDFRGTQGSTTTRTGYEYGGKFGVELPSGVKLGG